ncbi:APO RNA-binding protein (DUF794) isoform X2 [Wolffia australiana]
MISLPNISPGPRKMGTVFVPCSSSLHPSMRLDSRARSSSLVHGLRDGAQLSSSSCISGNSLHNRRSSSSHWRFRDSSSLIIKCCYPQNSDFPRYYSKREKKPFPIPVLELRRNARERQKRFQGKNRKPLPPPKNGMLVPSLIPVAYEVYNARILLINNLKRLLKAIPVHACRHCNEVHVGSEGHPFRTCHGWRAEARRGEHEWTTDAKVEDLLVPIEAYHLVDRLGKRLTHDERFAVPRVPALVELCVQAGLELPGLPTKRRRKPVIWMGRAEFIDADEDDLPDEPDPGPEWPVLAELPDGEAGPPGSEEETVRLAEEALAAWDVVRDGADRLMRRYAVRVCGYCPEVHIGPGGHRARNCGALKHQQRNGQHGWQAAVLDDLVPPRYVWHVPGGFEGRLERELRSFYGQAPAVVELCAQAGAAVPDRYRPTMRLDVGIPSSLGEAEKAI